MSGKLYLPARVPSLGAHRLAWWLIGPKSAHLRQLRMDLALRLFGRAKLDRIIAGEVVPSLPSYLTDGFVTVGMFERPGPRHWGVRPIDFDQAEA